jgi:phosphatidylserine decarboxylase
MYAQTEGTDVRVPRGVSQVAVVVIGAMLVGSIRLAVQRATVVRRLDELGYFAFGGSTVVCLFRAGVVVWDADLLDRSARQLESLVRVGNAVGRARPSP